MAKAPHNTLVSCLYCHGTIDLTYTFNNMIKYCKYKDCTMSYNNFIRSLKRLKQSKSKLMVEFAIQIQTAMDNGVSPKDLQPIMKFVNLNKKHLFKK